MFRARIRTIDLQALRPMGFPACLCRMLLTYNVGKVHSIPLHEDRDNINIFYARVGVACGSHRIAQVSFFLRHQVPFWRQGLLLGSRTHWFGWVASVVRCQSHASMLGAGDGIWVLVLTHSKHLTNLIFSPAQQESKTFLKSLGQCKQLWGVEKSSREDYIFSAILTVLDGEVCGALVGWSVG